QPQPQRLNVRLEGVTLEMVRELFGNTEPYADSREMVPGTDTWLPWIHALVLYRDAFCDCIGQIYRYSRFIDPELSSLLDAIEFSAFSTAVRMLKDLVPEAGKTKYGNPTLEVY